MTSDQDTVTTDTAGPADVTLGAEGGEQPEPTTDHADDAAEDDAAEDDAAEDDADADGDEVDARAERGEASLIREGDIAADYLEQFLDIVDVDGDIDLDVENDRAVVAVVGDDLSSLVGVNGATLDALQELVRLAVQQQTGARSRLMLDVGGHRQQRRAELSELAQATAERVRTTGEPARLTAMNPFERKVVHDVIAQAGGVRSESEGEEPNRRVVVHRQD